MSPSPDLAACRAASAGPPRARLPGRYSRRAARATRAAAAASTSAPTTELARSASGCHCTPSTKLASRSSIASGSSSSVETPLTSSPSPSRSTPWWWWDLRRCARLARGARRERALGEHHVVLGAVEGAEHATVLFVAEALGQVLHQRAAAGDVDQLHAAADAEQRHVALDRARARARSRTRRARAPCRRSRGAPAAVGGGVDVGAAGEDQAVDQLEQPARGSSASSASGGSISDESARPLHGLDVVERQQRGRLVPDAPARALERGADADHGTCHPPHHRINAAGSDRRTDSEESR